MNLVSPLEFISSCLEGRGIQSGVSMVQGDSLHLGGELRVDNGHVDLCYNDPVPTLDSVCVFHPKAHGPSN